MRRHAAAAAAAAAALLLLLAAPHGARAQNKEASRKAPALVTQSALPAARPPLWEFRTIGDSQVSFKTYGGGATSAEEMTVKHKVFKGVSDKALQWMFENLASGSAVSPIDNQTYPMFLLYHPRDHAAVTCSRQPCKNGAFATFVEFPLTGCTNASTAAEVSGGAAVCPRKGAPNPGFVAATQPAVWNASWSKGAGVEQTNGNPRVASSGTRKVAFHTKRCNEQGQCADIIKTTHNWKYNRNADELKVTTTLLVGMKNFQGSNPKIKNGWMEQPDKEKMDMQAKFWRSALHFTEEMGSIEEWLPQAYLAANPPSSRRNRG
ncbi:MAG: hypothetical protein J3K34DRAFT_441933 [Monoraphidium minutum]|nr:MAG: hypothetical protein J3K34DRAFT_441933 [Monoraphidium minutum]